MEEGRGRATWLPILVGAVVAVGTLFLWGALSRLEEAHFNRMGRLAAETVKSEITAQMETQALALVRLARRWEVRGSSPIPEWKEDAKLLVAHNPGYHAIEWVDPSFRVRWTVPVEGGEAVRFLDIKHEEGRKRAMETARDRRGVVVTRAVDLAQGGKGFEVYVPMFQGDTFVGFVTGLFRIQELYDFVLHDRVASGYSIAIFDGLNRIYLRDRGDVEEQGKWPQEATIEAYGVVWRVRVWPRPELLSEAQSLLPEAVLIGGIITALLLALATHLAQQARHRAEALREGEKRFRDLYDYAPVGYHEIDVEGRIVRVNRTALGMLGYEEEEVLGWHPWDFIVEAEASRQAVRAKLAGTDESLRSYERTWRRKDGSFAPVLMQDRILRDPESKITGIRSTIQDISERKRSEEALRENESQFRDLFDQAPVGYHEIDTEGHIVRVNRTALSMLGYTQEDVLGRYPWEFIVEQEESRKAVKDKLAGSESLAPYERTWRRKDGGVLPVLMQDRFIRDASGKVKGIRATILDNSGRRPGGILNPS